MTSDATFFVFEHVLGQDWHMQPEVLAGVWDGLDLGFP